MRRIAQTAAHSNINLRETLSQFADGEGSLDKKELKGALRQMKVAVSDSDISELFT